MGPANTKGCKNVLRMSDVAMAIQGHSCNARLKVVLMLEVVFLSVVQ